jgi:genome maintenance exonuclease 1
VSVSISKILQVLDNPEALQKWRDRVGHEEAERISKRSASIGTAMHKFLEHWIGDDKDCVDLTEEGILGRKMAQKIYDEYINHKLEDCWHMESRLKFGDHYHGRLDLAGIYYHQPVVIDFKQANKPKRREWCWKYMCQLAAYVLAHNMTFPNRPKIKKGIVLMCAQNLEVQKFELEGKELIKAWNHFKSAIRFCKDNDIYEVKPEYFDKINIFRSKLGLR